MIPRRAEGVISSEGDEARRKRSFPRSSRSAREPSSAAKTIQKTKMNAEKPTQFKLKLILLGAAHVGKTSTLMRYCRGDFDEKNSETIGMEFDTKILDLENGQAV